MRGTHGLALGIKARVFLLFAVAECVSHSGFPFSETPSIPLTSLILFTRGPQALWKRGRGLHHSCETSRNCFVPLDTRENCTQSNGVIFYTKLVGDAGANYNSLASQPHLFSQCLKSQHLCCPKI